ncbi:MAG: hypothetical protein GDA46_05255 [Bdellovibrionales bacterium]|nr:hypothetical protein [Bdellovibrionales bacterium]
MELKKKFLIRSSSEILGPYNKEEVITLIKTGKISAFDEVTEPYKIWIALENHKDFKKTVQSLNIQTRITNFLTQVSSKISISKNNPTKDKTLTNTSSLNQKDKTDEVSFNLLTKTSLKKASSSLEPSFKEEHKSSPIFKEKTKEDKRQKKIGFLVSLSWKLLVLISFFLIVFVLYQLFYTPIKKKRELLTNLNKEGKLFYEYGDFNQAFPFFKKAQAYLDENDKILFASLLIKKGEKEKANQIKEEINLANDKFFLLKAFISFYYKKYFEAEKQFQTLVSKSKDKNIVHEALVNLVILNWETGNYKESIKQIGELFKRNFERDVLWYLKALNLLSQKDFVGLENYLVNELSLMNDAFIREFKQEFYFLLAYTYMIQNKIQDMESVIKKILNQDPFFIKEYSYSLFIAKDKLNWKIFYPYCKDFLKLQTENRYLINSLYGICLIKTDRFKEAKSHIETIKTQEPQNNFYNSLYTYFLMSQQTNPQKIEISFSVINYDILTKETVLPFILKARFLEQEGYWEPALSIWKKLLQIDRNHLSALAGVSFNSYKLGDMSLANFYREKTLNKYPYHLKVLPIK